jgi:hypothetical protein
MGHRKAAIEIHNGLWEKALGIRRSGEECEPMAFLLLPAGETFQIGMVPGWQYGGKEHHLAAIKQAAAELGAMYVVYICEAWMAGGDEAQAAAAMAWMQQGKSLREFPGATEQLRCTIDGPDLNRWWQVDIRPDGTPGEPEVADSPEASGRFVNLSGRMGED